jgi:hypothetical protein
MAPWWWFLREPKHVGVNVVILIVLIFLWFYNCVHHCGKIKSALILLMHGTNMKIKDCCFLYVRSKNVFSTVQFSVPVSLVSTFHGPLELRRQNMTELLSLDHHRAPWMDRRAIHRTVHSVTDYQCCTKFATC